MMRVEDSTLQFTNKNMIWYKRMSGKTAIKVENVSKK